MRRHGFVLLIAMAVSTRTPLAKGGEGPEAGAAGQRLAVIVGVENYDDRASLGDLKYAVEDARELSEVLKLRGFAARDVRVLLGTSNPPDSAKAADRATRAAIDRAIDEAIARARNPEDSLIVAFSGHGLDLPEQGKFDSARSYFCPTDADPEVRDSMVDLAKLFEKLKDCGAGMKLVLVDACQYRVPGSKSRSLSGPSSSRRDFLPRPRNTAIFFGCDVGKESYEVEDLKHGLFMHCIIRAFRGEEEKAVDESTGHVTFESLQRYLIAEVPRLSKLYEKPTQSPTVSLDNVDPKQAIVRLDSYRNALKRLEAYRRNGEGEKAWLAAQEAVRLGPGEPATWLRAAELGQELQAMGMNADKVIRHASKAIDLLERDPNPRPADLASALWVRARSRYLDGKARRNPPPNFLELARADLDGCLKSLASASPGRRGDEVVKFRREAYLLRAEMALDAGDLAQVQASFTEFSRSHQPTDYFRGRPQGWFDFLTLRTRLMILEGKFDEARLLVDDLWSAAERLHDPKGKHKLVYLLEGRINRGLGELEAAELSFTNAFRTDKLCDEARLLKAEVLVDRLKYSDARDLFQKVIERRPSPEALVGMARAQIGLHQDNEARDSLDSALRRTDIVPQTRASALVARAKVRLLGSDADPVQAIEDCGLALKLVPELVEAREVLASARTRLIEAAGIQAESRRAIVPTSETKAAPGQDRPPSF